MRNRSKKILQELFELAGVSINGDNPSDIQVHNEDVYRRILSEGNLGLGESYMDGWWDCEELDQLICKIVTVNLENHIKGNIELIWHILKSKIFNLQKFSRAFQVGEQHYDIGNDLYNVMLDKRMLYTCGYWKDAKNLDDAQEAKLDLVCRKIGLKPGMTVLELGCRIWFICQICLREI